MNKLIGALGISLLCIGCVPVTQAPPPGSATVTPASVIIPAKEPVPSAGVIDMPAVILPGAAAVPTSTAMVTKHTVKPKSLAGVEMYPGSLKENIERIAAHYGWHQVVWDASQDFLWVGRAHIQGEDLTEVLRKLLADYPLQAIFYQGNHVLYIHQRTLR